MSISTLTFAAAFIFALPALAEIEAPQYVEAAGDQEFHDVLDWNLLPDPAAQNYEDPYLALNLDQLSDLVTTARLRERLQSAELADEVRGRIAERLQLYEDALAEQDIDVDWLLDQRWVVAERREKAAWAANPELDGTEITLAGFLIPGAQLDDGRISAYLVPQRGMCSHMPPPPPNQLVRFELDALPQEFWIYQPVLVKGRLKSSEDSSEQYVVDGMVPMLSAWQLNEAKIEYLQTESLFDLEADPLLQ